MYEVEKKIVPEVTKIFFFRSTAVLFKYTVCKEDEKGFGSLALLQQLIFITHIYTNTYTHTPAYTHIHTHTHARIYTHIDTHIYTYTREIKRSGFAVLRQKTFVPKIVVLRESNTNSDFVFAFDMSYI